jgi:hypothetical protein
MNEQLAPKTINLCAVKLAQTHSTRFAHGAQPVSAANALAAASAVGLRYVSRLDLDCFESQSVSSRLNQRQPNLM